jgi:transposase
MTIIRLFRGCPVDGGNSKCRGLEQTLAKTMTTLDEIAARIKRGKVRKDRAAMELEIQQATKAQWMNRLVTTTLTGSEGKDFRFSYVVDAKARKALEAELFGKRVLFTDRDDWSIADVVGAYRSQSDVESSFRQMKDPHVVGVSPMFHWTDQKIRVQLLCCVLALAVAHLMRREAKRNGLDMSVRALLDELARIQETVLLYASTGGRPKAQRMLTEMNTTQKHLFDIFSLRTLAPKS